MRAFESGAIRDSEEGKLDFEAALSPQVLWEFAVYMEKHCHLPDGTTRSADNWQAGFPNDVLMKSLLRHVMDLWMLHRGLCPVRPEDGKVVTWDDALGAAMFGIQAMWFNRLNGLGA
jgi:hypothetical protein